MRTYLRYFILTSSVLAISYFAVNLHTINNKPNKSERIRSSSSPKAGIKMKEARWDYFYKMLRDPKTNEIPNGIRQNELIFAKNLQEKNSLNKKANTNELEWKEAGPKDVGGRTRAIAVDVTNSNTIIAGGVSGGIWKSIDKGATWQMKSTTSQILSVTTIAQDPRSGKTNTWYYASGEFSGSSQDQGFTHRVSGGGVYKSTDNGETWNLLTNTKDTNPSAWNTPYDFVSKIIVNPVTGTVFIASHAFGIMKSTDGGENFTVCIGGENEHVCSDIVVGNTGTLIAAISSPFQGVTSTNQPGIYKSTDDGQTWINITPQNFPSFHYRNVVAIAPSNNNVAYVVSFTYQEITNKNDDVKFYKINVANGNSEDRSANMPYFNPGSTERFEEWINTQQGYNLVMAVKPDDENFVLIGATSLFRSTNGFATKPDNEMQDWIGGYNSISFNYPNFHCDIHSFSFEPNNPNAMWWGHDGGLSYTSDIRNTSYSEFFPWENKNNGYNVTQFYMVAIPDEAGDNRIMGGTQDNGTPSFRFDGTIISESYDVSTGDGSYCYFGNAYPYSSAQNGAVIRGTYDQNGNPRRDYPNWSNITPKDAQGMLFINPYLVDPADEEVMIYPAGNTLWRNNQLNSLPNNATFQEGITTGWTQLTNLSAPDGYVITALNMSVTNPEHRLYYAAVDYSQQASGLPKIYRMDNANTSLSGAVDISIAGIEPAYYVHNIAVNPDNGNELIVVFSNYNIVGLYYSNNGGQTFTAVEGNLQGDEQNPGPSIRGASILPTENGTQYFVATSTGVYSTLQLNAANTNWSLEGANSIGNVIVNYLVSRRSDGTIVAGTHGRGAFIAHAGSAGAAVAAADVNSLTLQCKPGEIGTAYFNLRNDGAASLNYNISVTGSFSGSLNKQNCNSYVMNVHRSRTTNSDRFKKRLIAANSNTNPAKLEANTNSKVINTLNSPKGNDVFYLDDGDGSADNVFGWAYGSDDIYWYNEFNLGDKSFALDQIYFYMQTNQATSNEVYLGIFDQDINSLGEQYFTLPTAPSGDWFTITLDTPIEFAAGETFYIELGSFSSIEKPIGVDIDAAVPNQSYFGDGYNYYNLNAVTGAENGAFIIRASGTLGGGGNTNQNPVAVANLSKTHAEINETINFDASGSYDNDGQITTYLWNFGDGESSAQKIATHSYSSANTFNFSLKVTDDKGGTNQTSGQVTISGSTNQYVIVSPASGSVAPGSSQKITLTLNAQAINEGTYTGQVIINSNGGSITIPIDYLVDVKKVSSIPDNFDLSQNYPNPFNPSTVIEFSIPNNSKVTLKVFDALGKEVINLIDEYKSAGKYSVNFDASILASGIYYYRLEADEKFKSRKMVLLK